MEKLIVKTEDELFKILENYISSGEISDNIDLLNLPPLKIRLVGEKFDQSLTPSVMKGFVEMQNYINRTYRLVKYGDVDTQKLSKEEREALQLKIKVEKGSSIIDVNFDGLWSQIGQLATKMDPTTLSVTVLGAAAIWATSSGIKRFLDNRKEVRLAEIKKEEDKDHLQSLNLMSQEETKRVELITKIVQNNVILENIDRQAHDAKTSMFKSFSSVPEVEIGGTTLDPETTNELTKNARRRSTEIRLDGIYKLEQVNSSDPNLFKVKIRNIETGVLFDAIVQDSFLEGNKNKLLLMQSEWDRMSVKLKINAKILDDKIKDAIILDVSELSK